MVTTYSTWVLELQESRGCVLLPTTAFLLSPIAELGWGEEKSKQQKVSELLEIRYSKQT